MAPNFYGAYFEQTCGDCGFHAALRGDIPIENPICPNCGATNSNLKLTRRAAPAVSVRDLKDSPKRWNVYAFSVLQTTGEKRMTVKRLVGMPNEKLSLSEGDLWIAGKRCLKNWDEQRSIAILVRDFRHLPRDESGKTILPWEPSGERTDWSITVDGLRHRQPTSPQQISRIEYINWAGYHSPEPRLAAVPIMNSQPFDPLEAGSLTPVYDLLITAEAKLRQSDFRLEWQVYSELLSIDFLGSQEKLVVRVGEKIVHSSSWNPPAGECLLGCSTFDRALTVALDNQQLLQIPLSLTPSTERKRLARPFAVECLGTQLELRNLKLYRDIYYLDRPAIEEKLGEQRDYKLKADEYFFLGDNPTDSIDSRDWSSAGLKFGRLIGSVDCSPEK